MEEGKGKGKCREGVGEGGNGNSCTSSVEEPPSNSDFDDQTCAICHEGNEIESAREDNCAGGAGASANSGEDLTLVRSPCCSIVMHAKCINTWLDKYSDCPVCHKQLKTKRARKDFFANKVLPTARACTQANETRLRRHMAREGEIGEDFRAKQARWHAKQREAELATLAMLKAERKGQESGGQEIVDNAETIRREQERFEKLLDDKKHNRTPADVEKDEALARSLNAQLLAHEKAAREREEEDEKLARLLGEEEEAKEATRKRQRHTEAEADVAEWVDSDGEGNSGGSGGECGRGNSTRTSSRQTGKNVRPHRRRRDNGDHSARVSGNVPSERDPSNATSKTASRSSPPRSSMERTSDAASTTNGGRRATNDAKRTKPSSGARARSSVLGVSGDGKRLKDIGDPPRDAGAGLAKAGNVRDLPKRKQDRDGDKSRQIRHSAGNDGELAVRRAGASPVSIDRHWTSKTPVYDLSSAE